MKITTANGRKLLQLVQGLNITYGLEHSFRIYPQTLLTDRYLLSLEQQYNSAKPDPLEKLLGICAILNMPKHFIAPVRDEIDKINMIHLGYENNNGTTIYKFYMEHYPTESNTNNPDLLHLSFKWDPDNPETNAISRYWHHPNLEYSTIRDNISRLYDQFNDKTSLTLANQLLTLAEQRASHNDIMYLEVDEHNNSRKSFDINMYNAEMSLANIGTALISACASYNINSDDFNAFFEQIKQQEFGHISGGVDRNGNNFATIYYGVKFYKP